MIIAIVKGRDPRVDAYIADAAPFAQPILKHFRAVVHRACPDVTETIKWRFPHFDYKGLLCGMAAFKAHCAFTFWKGTVIFGTKNESDKAMGRLGRVTSIKDLPDEKILAGYVRKSVELNEQGTKSSVRTRQPREPIRVPPDLADALKKNAKARTTFENFSPTNQREYVEWLMGAKRQDTRERRLRTAIQWLSEGKPHNWRYL